MNRIKKALSNPWVQYFTFIIVASVLRALLMERLGANIPLWAFWIFTGIGLYFIVLRRSDLKWRRIEGTPWEFGIRTRGLAYEIWVRTPKRFPLSISKWQKEKLGEVIRRTADQVGREIAREVNDEHIDELRERGERFWFIFGPLAPLFWPLTAKIWVWQLEKKANRAFEEIVWEACAPEAARILNGRPEREVEV